MRKFEIPNSLSSEQVKAVKDFRKNTDPRKEVLLPTVVRIRDLEFYFARHFGFCFGVENAVEIAYKAIAENPGQPIFMLSQMIHNPRVTGELLELGLKYLYTTAGEEIIPIEEVPEDSVIIIPAFGATLPALERINSGKFKVYNTTCPFVEKVWRRAVELGKKGFTIIVHGKKYHEETKATVSHASQFSKTIVIRDQKDAELLLDYVRKPNTEKQLKFQSHFSTSLVAEDFVRIAVVNQTTMLASETSAISEYLRLGYKEIYGDKVDDHFGNTRDTLCYATNENQRAVGKLLEFAQNQLNENGGNDKVPSVGIIVGGFNSSNTVNLASMFREVLPSFHVEGAANIQGETVEFLGDARTKQLEVAHLPHAKRYFITGGASTPDVAIYEIVLKLAQRAGIEIHEVNEAFAAPQVCKFSVEP